MIPVQTFIDTAKKWVRDWEFVEIEEICWRRDNGAGGLWYPPFKDRRGAKICLGWGEPQDGLWHEVFHSVAHNAPLMKTNGEWGEGWCCAFSEVYRREFTTVNLAVPPASDFEMLYQWPVYHLTRLVGYQRERLRDLWFEWNSKPALPGDFSRFMGYDPKTGLTLEAQKTL